ncbi:MAG: HD domain-containing protein [Cyanobacteria bacterium NC_groundwater_1444_Ag_S-0.65um_54_12]|nr:HD domain-containing protein [Cyanobacteria bacterium NC_groundwater_1444_Ag_S-0.65um_54_12]
MTHEARPKPSLAALRRESINLWYHELACQRSGSAGTSLETGKLTFMLNAPFVLRDVIHGYIDFPDDLLGRMALDILQTPAFQRLRQLHQLGLGRLLFPSAEHSRFAHSLGTYQLARLALAELDRQVLIGHLTPQGRTAIGLAALLHDLGHGIFSHTAERIWDFNHEAITDRLIMEDPALQTIWQRHDKLAPSLPTQIVQIRNGTELPADQAFLHDLISSQLDVDRMDYLLRDAYMTGVRYGGFDLSWVLRHITVVEWQGQLRLAVQEKAADALSQYLLARFHMYKNVYEHRTVRIYDAMLHGLMLRLRYLEPSWLDSLQIGWLLQPLGEDLAAFLLRDDYAMWEALKRIAASSNSDPLSRRLAADLLCDRRWDGEIREGTSFTPAHWEGTVFVTPYSRGQFYNIKPEAEVLIVSAGEVKPLSEDPRVLRFSYTEPPAILEIRPPLRSNLLV